MVSRYAGTNADARFRVANLPCDTNTVERELPGLSRSDSAVISCGPPVTDPANACGSRERQLGFGVEFRSCRRR